MSNTDPPPPPKPPLDYETPKRIEPASAVSSTEQLALGCGSYCLAAIASFFVTGGSWPAFAYVAGGCLILLLSISTFAAVYWRWRSLLVGVIIGLLLTGCLAGLLLSICGAMFRVSL